MGVVQLRMVAGFCFLSSAAGIGIQLYGLVLTGTLMRPFQLISAIVWGVLAYMLLKGSRIARVLLAVLSALGLAVALLFGGLAMTAESADPAILSEPLLLALVVAGGLVSAACFYLLVFSKSVGAEMRRRAEPAKQREDEKRRKFYESLGE